MRRFFKNIALKSAAFSFALALLSQGGHAAPPCPHDCDFYSREDAFLKSEAVFAGIAETKNETGTLFKVVEWYRSPNESFSKADKVLVTSVVGEGYASGVEYIVHGKVHPKTTAALPVVENRSCWGIIKTSTDNLIADLEKWEKLPEETADTAEGITFIGKVTQAQHKKSNCVSEDPKHGPKGPRIDSKIEFEILRIFQKKNHQTTLHANDKISVDISDCGMGYELGKTYLADARQTKNGEFWSHCFPPNRIDNLDEKDFLREMGKKVNNHP